MSTVKLKKGEMLFKENDQSKSCYFIKTGILRVFKEKYASLVELESLRAGQIIGELSFLDNQPRSASAEAITECELVEISQKILDDTLSKTPDWLKVLIKTVTSRMRAASNKIRILESASSEYETDKWGNRSKEFVFVNRIELMRFFAGTTIVASRYGKEDSIDSIQFLTTSLERFISQIMQMHESKVASLIELMKTVNLFKPVGEDVSKPSLLLTDIQFIDQSQWFLNEQNMLEVSKQRTLSNRGFLILTLLMKHMDTATDCTKADEKGLSTLNFAPVLSAEGKSLCNPALRPDELQELMDQKFIHSVTLASAEQMDVVFNQKKLPFEFRLYWILNELDKLNEKKRKVK